MANDADYLFMYLLVILFSTMSLCVFCHSLIGLFVFMVEFSELISNSLYTRSLSGISFAYNSQCILWEKIFYSLGEDISFVLSAGRVFHTARNFFVLFLILRTSITLNFPFIDCSFSVKPENFLALDSEDFFPLCFSESVIVIHFTFKSLIRLS